VTRTRIKSRDRDAEGHERVQRRVHVAQRLEDAALLAAASAINAPIDTSPRLVTR
jgi:hypothetical protein